MDGFGPTGYSLEKDSPYDGSQKSTLQAQIDGYRFPVPLYQEPSSEYSNRSQSQASNRSLLPMYHERGASDSSILSLGRPITPVDQLQKMLAVPPPAVEKSSVAGSPKSQLSLDTSMRSLPAPPRRNVSPSSSISSTNWSQVSPPNSPIATPEGVWAPATPSSAQQHIRHPSATFGEQWASHRASQSWSSNQPAINQPALSAVKSTFPSPVPRPLLLSNPGPSASPYSQNQPLPSYSPNQRPLLLSRNNSASPGEYRPPVTPVPQAF